MDVKPRLVIFVMIDEPENKNRTGGKTAAPIFRKIGEGILALCGGKPKEPDIIMASSPVRYGTSGQTPHRSVLVRKGSRPGSWIVPDMKGFEMRQMSSTFAEE